METAGLVAGNMALASLLATCLDGCNYVTLGCQYEKEIDMAFAKFLLVKGWLGAAGATVRAGLQGGENQVPGLRAEWERQKNIVRTTLAGVQILVRDSKKLRDNYQPAGAGAAGSSELTQITTVHLSGEMRAIEPPPSSYLSSTSSSSTTTTTTTTATALAGWSPEELNKFNRLIAELDGFVEHLQEALVHLGNASPARQAEIIQQAVQAVPEPASIRLLAEASGGGGPRWQRAAGFTGEPVRASGPKSKPLHFYYRNIVNEEARAILGDIGFPNASCHVGDYRENKISGKSHAVLGNVDGSFATSFFRRT